MSSSSLDTPSIYLPASAPAAVLDSEPVVFESARKQHPDSDFGIAGRVSRKGIYGAKSDLTEVTILPGYHSLPHTHDCEQMSICLEGEMWMFVGEEGFHVRKGDFHRVPKDAVHWAWNPSGETCKIIVSHVPRVLPEPGQASYLSPAFSADETGWRSTQGVRSVFTDFYGATDVEARRGDFEDNEWSPFAPTLLMRAEQYPRYRTSARTLARKTRLQTTQERYPDAKFDMFGLLAWRRVRGNEGDITSHERQPGYHSPPHIDATDEQMNYCVSGETMLFVDGEGYRLKAGDFLRVPPNAVHWAYIVSDEPSILVETHVPCHITVTGLYKIDEEPKPTPQPRPGGFVEPSYAIEVERRVLGKNR